MDSPRKPTTALKPRHAVFEGDAAAVELRSRLAKAREGALLPVPRDASGFPAFGAVLRFTGLVLAAAAVAGVAGYLAGGVKLPFIPAPIAAPSGEADAPLRPSAIEVAPGGARRSAGNDAGRAGAAQQRGPQPLPMPDASETAARLKPGDAERDVLYRQFMMWREQQRK